MKHKIPTVTVAVSAYNEADNIIPFLTSVISQKEQGFRLKKIIIASDGSSDATVLRTKSLHNKKIILHAYKKRMGKSLRLNEFYQNLDTDYLIQSDADVVFTTPYIIRDLVRVMEDNPEVGMCGGNPLPKEAQTFVERAVNSTVFAYVSLRSRVRNGNNPLSADGRLLAFRKACVSQIHVPHDMIANDRYSYYASKYLGWEYRFVPTAVVQFRSPQTIHDQIRQNTRFVAAPMRMQRYFPPSLVQQEEAIPLSLTIRVALSAFIAHPLGMLVITITNRYCHLRARYMERNLTARWDMATTTKQL